MSDIRQYDYYEHLCGAISLDNFPEQLPVSKLFGDNSKRFCYICVQNGGNVKLEAGYFIGVDWLVEGHSSIVVAPKLNTRLEDVTEKELQEDGIDNVEIDAKDIPGKQVFDKGVTIDYSAMLLQCLSVDFLYEEIKKLVYIDWRAEPIPIKQEQDWLSPLLIVQFLINLKRIVRKGLRKSYYKVSQNLSGKAKGKILVAEQVKRNVFKNNLTKVFCEYEEYDINSAENRLLKKALQFSSSYLDNHKSVFNHSFSDLQAATNYCRPAFETVSGEVTVYEVNDYRLNPFFAEYEYAIRQAKLIIRRYAYSLSNTSASVTETPPYWIDMPKLFELYVYHVLKCKFPARGELKYHVRTYGNELDFLINSKDNKIVVDAKYKPVYVYGKNHKDIRQLAGYSRLEKVYHELEVEENEIIDCLIVYPDIHNGCDLGEFLSIDLKTYQVKGYRNVYKVGIKLPVK